MLLRLVIARMGSADEAEDILQDMWLRLSRPIAQPVAEPVGYLYRMAQNLVADRRLSASRRQARDTVWIDGRPGDADAPDAERALIGRERLARIERAIAAMPERMQTALRLFRIDQVPQRDIAARLGITVSGVEKLLRRAYVNIQQADATYSADCADGKRLGGEEDGP